MWQYFLTSLTVKKGAVISAVEGTAWWIWISYDNMVTVIELVIIAQSPSLSLGSERQLLVLYEPSLQGCDIRIIYLQWGDWHPDHFFLWGLIRPHDVEAFELEHVIYDID